MPTSVLMIFAGEDHQHPGADEKGRAGRDNPEKVLHHCHLCSSASTTGWQLRAGHSGDIYDIRPGRASTGRRLPAPRGGRPAPPRLAAAK